MRITTWGESHGAAVGVVIEGFPAGVPISESDIQLELDRRKPGQSAITSARKEEDKVKILSGVFEGKTLGTPISLIVFNKDADSSKYEKIKNTPRPGHADLTYRLKFGHVDYRGGGRAAARETVGRVIAGALAKKLIEKKGIEISGRIVEVGGEAEQSKFNDVILAAKADGDSVGGVVEIVANNVPAGLGSPVFDKLDAEIAKAMMSIGAVKAVEIGAGTAVAKMKGSECNDAITGMTKTKTNNAGGILGGISNGMPILVRITVKPTPSIAKEQDTIDITTGKPAKIKVEGRHDPCICPRIVPVAEAMLAIVLANELMKSKGSLRDKIDAVDDSIIALLNERMELAKQIGKEKKQKGKSIEDKEREAEVREHWREFPEMIDVILKRSKKIQGGLV